MSNHDFKEVYNVKYFIGFILALGIPTLPMSLTLIELFS